MYHARDEVHIKFSVCLLLFENPVITKDIHFKLWICFLCSLASRKENNIKQDKRKAMGKYLQIREKEQYHIVGELIKCTRENK